MRLLATKDRNRSYLTVLTFQQYKNTARKVNEKIAEFTKLYKTINKSTRMLSMLNVIYKLRCLGSIRPTNDLQPNSVALLFYEDLSGDTGEMIATIMHTRNHLVRCCATTRSPEVPSQFLSIWHSDFRLWAASVLLRRTRLSTEAYFLYFSLTTIFLRLVEGTLKRCAFSRAAPIVAVAYLLYRSRSLGFRKNPTRPI